MATDTVTTTTKDKGPIGMILPILSAPNYSGWYTLAGTAPRFPRLDIKTIVDPKVEYNIGPARPDYLAGISMLKNAGVEVLGLMNVDPSADTSQDIWRIRAMKEFYPQITGIVFQGPRPHFESKIGKLVKIAKKGFDTVVLVFNDTDNWATTELANSEQLVNAAGGLGHDTVDICLINKNDDGPSPDAIGTVLNVDWMKKKYRPYQFGIILSPKDQLRLNEFRNQIYAIYTHNVARYIYVRNPNDHTDQDISPYFESTLLELDKLADAEGKMHPPGWKMTGYEMTPNTIKESGGPDDPGGADGTDKRDIAPSGRDEYDVSGVRKLYADDIHSNIVNPKVSNDGKTKTFKDKAIIYELKDGMENLEYTIYIKRVDKQKKDTFDPYDPMYVFGIYNKDKSGYRVEVDHGGFTNINKVVNGIHLQQRAAQGTNHSLREWLGFKFVFYQYWPSDFKDDVNPKHVKVELWMDENCTTKEGELHIANKWRPVQETDDHGRWIYPKKFNPKKVPENGFKVVAGKFSQLRVDFNTKIKVEVGYANIRPIKAPRVD